MIKEIATASLVTILGALGAAETASGSGLESRSELGQCLIGGGKYEGTIHLTNKDRKKDHDKISCLGYFNQAVERGIVDCGTIREVDVRYRSATLLVDIGGDQNRWVLVAYNLCPKG